MWDNASLLRTLANALFLLGAVLALYYAARYALHLPVFPLRTVELASTPRRVEAELLQKTVREQVNGNFFTVDLDRTRQAFERLPWVRKVSVRRKFPWGLRVEIEEQVALARWNGVALVNTYGEVFTARTDEALPAFMGQPDASRQVAQMYADWSEVLRPMQQRIAQISLSPRYAWQVRLEGGMVLELGREEMRARLQRFVQVYPSSLDGGARMAQRVDLRYRDGFAAYLPGSEV